MEIKLNPKNIIVVGGGSGIGFATTQRLLDGGAKNIIIASRNIQKLQVSACKFNKTSTQNVFCLQMDISNVSKQVEYIENAQNLIGKINPLDGLVLSGGINFDGSNWKGFNISETEWDNVMNINLKGTFFMMRNFANYLHGNNRKGNICIVSSISAHRDLLSVYQISKNAISRIVHTYGKYLCERGVILNCVEPGTTDTDMMPHLKAYTDGKREGKSWPDNSIRRVIRPEEIAEVIYFLMSNMGEVMSGSCVLCGGGAKSIFF